MAGLRRGLGALGQVALDQRVPELPLGARELDAVPLQCSMPRATIAQLLALADELGDAHREELDVRAATAPLEASRPQMPQ